MSDVADATSEPTVPERLLALQAIDTESDQLRHRREKSALRDAFAAASTQLATWERERQAFGQRIDELDAVIRDAEAKSAELRAHRGRLEQQLRTVIAPREAEALQHEIATINQQDDELDNVEIEALEEQSTLDDERSVHLRDQETVTTAVRLADDALAAEVAQIDARLDELAGERGPVAAAVPASLLSTYDRKREAFGVAVAALVAKQCQGCHLELSAAEVDTAKDDAADTGVTDCPNCGRLLIV